MKKTLLLGIVFLLLVVLTTGVSAQEVTATGQCGDNLTWTLYDDGELEITGTGAMGDYFWDPDNAVSDSPWWDCREILTGLRINEGVTTIGCQAFTDCSGFTGSLTISDGVTTINEGAFNGCSALIQATVYARNVIFGVGIFADTHADFTIYGYTGSTAEAYATANNHPFVPLAGGVLGQITSNDPTKSITVQLRQGETVVYTHTIEAEEGSGEVTQSFFFPTVDAGTYDLVIIKAGHLPYTIQGLPVGEETVDLQDLILLTADGTFNRSSAEAVNKSCDVNGDGSIDLKDLIILTSENNFNRGAIEIPFTELSA